MQRTPQGAHAAQLGPHERHALAERLMAGEDARADVGGICCDVVAFVRDRADIRVRLSSS